LQGTTTHQGGFENSTKKIGQDHGIKRQEGSKEIAFHGIERKTGNGIGSRRDMMRLVDKPKMSRMEKTMENIKVAIP